jgi:DNA-binding NarL/FixJ family response regulator
MFISGQLRMNILIIEDHPLFREGLQYLLSDLSDGLVFHGSPGVGSIADDTLHQADLILLDLHTVDSHGLQSLCAIRQREPAGAIVVISSDDDADLVRDCIDRGAVGFIPKTSEAAVLVAALKLVLAGGIYLPPDCVLSPHKSTADTQVVENQSHGLTKRQVRAMLLVARGHSNKKIADTMGITEGTVKLHLSAAFKTLNVKNRTEAVFALSQLGFKESDTG